MVGLLLKKSAVIGRTFEAKTSSTELTEPCRNMASNLPVDILPMILKNLDKADLATMCRVNKVCCSFSQDILYRNIDIYNRPSFQVCQTLAYSTHLARRVRSFRTSFYPRMESNLDNLATALRNMSFLRILHQEIALGMIKHYMLLFSHTI
jgi:hypothetical protein